MMSENCDGALSELYAYLDGELTEDDRVAVEGHLRNCSPCLEAFDFQAEIRKVIANRCQDRCPDELRARIAAAIAECAKPEN